MAPKTYLLILFPGKISEFCVVRQPCQIHCTNRTISLFSDDDLRLIRCLCILIVIIITINKHYHVGILLDGS